MMGVVDSYGIMQVAYSRRNDRFRRKLCCIVFVLCLQGEDGLCCFLLVNLLRAKMDCSFLLVSLLCRISRGGWITGWLMQKEQILCGGRTSRNSRPTLKVRTTSRSVKQSGAHEQSCLFMQPLGDVLFFLHEGSSGISIMARYFALPRWWTSSS